MAKQIHRDHCRSRRISPSSLTAVALPSIYLQK
jgi:hypothetical protein